MKYIKYDCNNIVYKKRNYTKNIIALEMIHYCTNCPILLIKAKKICIECILLNVFKTFRCNNVNVIFHDVFENH